jgi:predicted amidophosphoribosyltransferase
MECPVCGKTYAPDDRFCSKCGTLLAEEQPRGRFRPLFQKTQDPSSAWDNYVRPFATAALIFCLGLLALAGIAFLIDYLLISK